MQTNVASLFGRTVPIESIPLTATVGPMKMDRTVQTAETVREFEALFVSMMIKEMRQSGAQEGLFAGDKSDTYGGMFDMFMGRHIAEGGGLGLASYFELTQVPIRGAREAYQNESARHGSPAGD